MHLGRRSINTTIDAPGKRSKYDDNEDENIVPLTLIIDDA